ncbi:MAG: hypothetical protein ACOZIN_22860 [Myxococcota bacterium]
MKLHRCFAAVGVLASCAHSLPPGLVRELEAHTFPLSIDAARERLRAVKDIRTQGAPFCLPTCPVERLEEEDGELVFILASASQRELARVRLIARGPEQVSAVCDGFDGGKLCARWLWELLGPEGLAEAEARARAAAEKAAAERTDWERAQRQVAWSERMAEEASFQPMWGSVGMATLNFEPGGLTWGGFGLRGGARRWHTPSFISGYYLDYGLIWFTLPSVPPGISGSAHLLAPTARLEIYRWEKGRLPAGLSRRLLLVLRCAGNRARRWSAVYEPDAGDGRGWVPGHSARPRSAAWVVAQRGLWVVRTQGASG